MALFTWTLAALIDRAWLAIGTEQSEAEKTLYKDELVALLDDVLQWVGQHVADDPVLRPLLQAEFLTVLASGRASLSDGAYVLATSPLTTAPRWITSAIERIEHDDSSDVQVFGTVTPMYRLANPDMLYRGLRPDRKWWTERGGFIETADESGQLRTLTGKLRVWTSYIPTVTTFPNIEQLQLLVVDRLKALALGKRSDKALAALVAAAA